MRIIAIFALLIISAPHLLALEAKEVAIVYNDNALGSKAIAKAYAEARGIPEERWLALKSPQSEEISRSEYKESIKSPVAAFLKKHDSVIALVLCRGVPLKIKETDKSDDKRGFVGRDFAAVDSELSTLRLADHPLTTAFQNPFLNKEANLTREDEVLIVHRLDGPTQEIALGLIEKAILAEAFGCYGQSVLDTGPEKPSYQHRDREMAKIATIWSEAKLDFFHDDQAAVYDLSSHPQSPLHYNGWYTGSPSKWRKPLRFRTGAIAVHLHSFSASTLRDVKKNWCAPLLNWGATATIGTVYEPYTVGFPYEAIYWDRLMKGYSFGDAGVMSNHHISWMAVFIGDPLYTPYKKGREEAFKERRTLLAEMLAAKEDKADQLAKEDRLLIAAHRLIRKRVEHIASTMKKQSKRALEAFGELSTLTRDMKISDAISPSLGDMNKALGKRFRSIKSDLRKYVNDTEAYQQAREAWQGLEIMEEIEKYHPTLVKAQVKAAKAWLKKAKSREKSSPFDAWFNANQAALCVYAPEQASEAQTLADKIDAAHRKEKKYLKTPNQALKNIRDKAQRKAKSKQADAIEMLRRAIRDYPHCSERKRCQEELDELLGVSKKKKTKK